MTTLPSDEIISYKETDENVPVQHSDDAQDSNERAEDDIALYDESSANIALGDEGNNSSQNGDYELPLALSICTESVIHDYFSSIDDVLRQYSHYDGISRSIDFLKMRRFLLTTYNTLVDLDLDLKKTKISNILKELNTLSNTYDAFRQTSKQSKRAFGELFLNRHDDFVKAQEKLEANKLAIAKHNSNIHIAETAIAKLNTIAQTTPAASPNFTIIEQRIKKARRIASDEIHNMREREEENRQLFQFIDMIINENEESFTQKYIPKAREFNTKITDLLNKIAYSFDASLWQQARDSKPIKNYFSESPVKGKLSSLTYLKYYLQSLNSDKLSDDQRELADLVPYLETLHRRSLLYFSAEVENAMRLKAVVTSIDKHIEIETTLHYDKAVESVMKKVPDFIFIDYQLPDLKLLIKTLKISGIIQNTAVVLVVENASASFLEQVKKIHIRYLLPTLGSNHIYAQTLARILDEE